MPVRLKPTCPAIVIWPCSGPLVTLPVHQRNKAAICGPLKVNSSIGLPDFI